MVPATPDLPSSPTTPLSPRTSHHLRSALRAARPAFEHEPIHTYTPYSSTVFLSSYVSPAGLHAALCHAMPPGPPPTPSATVASEASLKVCWDIPASLPPITSRTLPLVLPSSTSRYAARPSPQCLPPKTPCKPGRAGETEGDGPSAAQHKPGYRRRLSRVASPSRALAVDLLFPDMTDQAGSAGKKRPAAIHLAPKAPSTRAATTNLPPALPSAVLTFPTSPTRRKNHPLSPDTSAAAQSPAGDPSPSDGNFSQTLAPSFLPASRSRSTASPSDFLFRARDRHTGTDEQGLLPTCYSPCVLGAADTLSTHRPSCPSPHSLSPPASPSSPTSRSSPKSRASPFLRESTPRERSPSFFSGQYSQTLNPAFLPGCEAEAPVSPSESVSTATAATEVTRLGSVDSELHVRTKGLGQGAVGPRLTERLGAFAEERQDRIESSPLSPSPATVQEDAEPRLKTEAYSIGRYQLTEDDLAELDLPDEAWHSPRTQRASLELSPEPQDEAATARKTSATQIDPTAAVPDLPIDIDPDFLRALQGLPAKRKRPSFLTDLPGGCPPKSPSSGRSKAKQRPPGGSCTSAKYRSEASEEPRPELKKRHPQTARPASGAPARTPEEEKRLLSRSLARKGWRSRWTDRGWVFESTGSGDIGAREGEAEVEGEEEELVIPDGYT